MNHQETEAKDLRTKAAMLDSMAASFEIAMQTGKLEFSFNGQDMADLMRFCSEKVSPEIRPAIPFVQE